MIDRLGPTVRPDGNADGTQRWESLLFCHWEIAADTLRKSIPPGLEVDTFEGRAFVGIVPFKMRRIRPAWLPRRLAFNFYETNVRTYVTCDGQPGVYFFSLDASSRLAVLAARIGWSLPYYHATMTDQVEGQTHSYRSHRKGGQARHAVSYRVGEQMGASIPGTLEHFLFERYLLFVDRKGVIHRGQVHHQPYQVRAAEILHLEDQLIATAGLPDLGEQPCLAHYSPGVDVEVFGIRPV